MRLQFKHQKFQSDAAKAVVDVFAGQPYLTPTYMMDRGAEKYHQLTDTDEDFTGWANQKLIHDLTDDVILEHIRTLQRANQIKPSDKLEGRYNITVEMETGVGKTYTYIKTMYELNKAYGWSKFIVVVPSIAIREGVYKSFDITQKHFAEEYGKKINSAVFPGTQGGPLMHVIAAKAVCLGEALKPEFKTYGENIVKNAQALADGLTKRGCKLVSGGTDNHVMLLDLTDSEVTGKELEHRLDEVQITANKNTVPNEKRSPFVTSGVRLGTPAVTTRGFGVEEMDKIAEYISLALNDFDNNKDIIRQGVNEICDKFPLYK